MAIVLNNNGKNACLAGGLTNAVTHISLHTATPDANGSNASAAARQAVAWGSPSAGSVAISGTEAFTGGAASGAVAAVGLWSAATSGTYYGHVTITSGDTTFNAAGEYTVDSLTAAIA